MVGPVPGVRGFWLLSGCCVGGLSISPALGEQLAQWIVAGEPELDLSEVTIDRFVGRDYSEAELRELCRQAYAHHYTAMSQPATPPPPGRRAE